MKWKRTRRLFIGPVYAYDYVMDGRIVGSVERVNGTWLASVDYSGASRLRNFNAVPIAQKWVERCARED